jgi:hypothetical protein
MGDASQVFSPYGPNTLCIQLEQQLIANAYLIGTPLSPFHWLRWSSRPFTWGKWESRSGGAEPCWA